jgi:hypothetical protein
MKRTSRLSVLVRLARLAEVQQLRVFGGARRDLEDLDQRIAAARAQGEQLSSAPWLAQHTAVSVDELRRVAHQGAYTQAQITLLGQARGDALERLSAARKEVTTARLRRRALEDVERRRLQHASRALQKREERRLEEAQRGRSEVQRAHR